MKMKMNKMLESLVRKCQKNDAKYSVDKDNYKSCATSLAGKKFCKYYKEKEVEVKIGDVDLKYTINLCLYNEK